MPEVHRRVTTRARSATMTSEPAKQAESPLVDVCAHAQEVMHVESRAAPSRAKEQRLGSKANEATWKTIINQMPPHHTYIEPFLGWGAIMLHKAPANHSICLDLEAEKVKNFLLELATVHPTMGSGIVNSTDALLSTIGNNAAGGHQRVLQQRQLGRGERSQPSAASPTCTLVVADALAFLASYPWRGDELVYCDPPYLLETRSSRRRYLFEMDELQHRALLDIIKKIPANVMVSGYKSKLYTKALKRWRLITFEAITRGGTTRTEHLWCNFSEPVELHDYRWVGQTYRQRQDLNRMRRRWTTRLGKMSDKNRRALYAAIQEFYKREVSAGADSGLCPCGCGRRLTGKQRSATAACRKRLQRLKEVQEV